MDSLSRFPHSLHDDYGSLILWLLLSLVLSAVFCQACLSKLTLSRRMCFSVKHQLSVAEVWWIRLDTDWLIGSSVSTSSLTSSLNPFFSSQWWMVFADWRNTSLYQPTCHLAAVPSSRCICPLVCFVCPPSHHLPFSLGLSVQGLLADFDGQLAEPMTSFEDF